jgi:hypothetical protein
LFLTFAEAVEILLGGKFRDTTPALRILIALVFSELETAIIKQNPPISFVPSRLEASRS